MAIFSKELLSASTGGQLIKVVETSSVGTTIHTTGTSATVIDEVWLYAVNTSGTDEKLTIEFGGTASPDNLIEVTVAAESGLYLIVPGLALTGTGASPRTITAFSASGNVINIGGYVNRITP